MNAESFELNLIAYRRPRPRRGDETPARTDGPTECVQRAAQGPGTSACTSILDIIIKSSACERVSGAREISRLGALWRGHACGTIRFTAISARVLGV